MSLFSNLLGSTPPPADGQWEARYPAARNPVDPGFRVSARPTFRGNWEARYRVLPDTTPVGVNFIMPDSELIAPIALQGNGTIFTHPSPMNGRALVAGEVVTVTATFDNAGQITFGSPLANADPNARFDTTGFEPFK